MQALSSWFAFPWAIAQLQPIFFPSPSACRETFPSDSSNLPFCKTHLHTAVLTGLPRALPSPQLPGVRRLNPARAGTTFFWPCLSPLPPSHSVSCSCPHDVPTRAEPAPSGPPVFPVSSQAAFLLTSSIFWLQDWAT